ncbi:MAG: polyprenyl synthetase family protein, partial [Candidatus Pacebacteria bacterium]|nr:polyprenyl synthetase family protein [Candidatus Paceibacterota bacterium]
AGLRLGMVDDEAARVFGRNMAILAGDIVHGWSVHVLGQATHDGIPAEIVNALLARLTGWVTPELISGEALDVEYVHRESVTVDEIENMLLMKTGVLLQFAAEAGVMVGKGTPDWGDADVRQASRFAARAGMAFQLQDDILGMFGSEERLGKPICSDLRERKQTVLLVKTLEAATPAERATLQSLVGKQELSEEEAATARRVITDSGALQWTCDRAASLVGDAEKCLAAFPHGPHRQLLKAWLDFLIDRQH